MTYEDNFKQMFNIESITKYEDIYIGEREENISERINFLAKM